LSRLLHRMELGLVSLRDEHVDNPKEDADCRCSIARQPACQIRHWNVQPIGEPPRSAEKVRRANQRGPVRVFLFRHRAAISPQRWRLRYRALALQRSNGLATPVEYDSRGSNNSLRFADCPLRICTQPSGIGKPAFGPHIGSLVLGMSRTLRPFGLREQVQGFQQNLIGHWNRTIQKTLKQRRGNAEPGGGLLLAPKYRH
jgi:hypothetical protein